MGRDPYAIEFLPSAARQLEKLPRGVNRLVAEAIDQLASEPRPEGSKLLAGTGRERIWRIAVGNYRVLYQIEDQRLIVLIVRVADRRDVYKQAALRRRLTVLQARMNPDLAMGDELLKKTGSGNLFMVFGEPDIEVQPTADGRLTVEVCGLDVYDPTTGVLRSSSVDDICAWFLDTDYDGDAFIVRHAYFTGADDPYDKLRRAFPRPKTGKVAIKVINHYGDEVMKVYSV